MCCGKGILKVVAMMNSDVNHCYRKTNQVADVLANMLLLDKMQMLKRHFCTWACLVL